MPINNIAKRVRFFGVDGYIAAPLLFTFLYPRLSTIYVLLAVSAILLVLERFGIPLPMLFRIIRTFFVGKQRYIRPYWRK